MLTYLGTLFTSFVWLFSSHQNHRSEKWNSWPIVTSTFVLVHSLVAILNKKETIGRRPPLEFLLFFNVKFQKEDPSYKKKSSNAAMHELWQWFHFDKWHGPLVTIIIIYCCCLCALEHFQGRENAFWDCIISNYKRSYNFLIQPGG